MVTKAELWSHLKIAKHLVVVAEGCEEWQEIRDKWLKKLMELESEEIVEEDLVSLT